MITLFSHLWEFLFFLQFWFSCSIGYSNLCSIHFNKAILLKKSYLWFSRLCMKCDCLLLLIMIGTESLKQNTWIYEICNNSNVWNLFLLYDLVGRCQYVIVVTVTFLYVCSPFPYLIYSERTSTMNENLMFLTFFALVSLSWNF
jgi:hypothetical protein